MECTTGAGASWESMGSSCLLLVMPYYIQRMHNTVYPQETEKVCNVRPIFFNFDMGPNACMISESKRVAFEACDNYYNARCSSAEGLMAACPGHVQLAASVRDKAGHALGKHSHSLGPIDKPIRLAGSSQPATTTLFFVRTRSYPANESSHNQACSGQ